MSRKSTLRWLASTMYSTAEATSPDSASPDTLAWSGDMVAILLRPEAIEIVLRFGGVDLGQGNGPYPQALLSRGIAAPGFGCISVFPDPRHQQLPGYGENDWAYKQPDNPVRQGTSDQP